MTGTLIATTQKAAVHALAFQGIMVYSCFAQIRDMIRRKFGDEYVLLFAKPVENTQISEIDWYTPVFGAAQSLDSLSPDARDAAYKKASSMARDIEAYAEELIHSPDPHKVTRGNILKLALCYPDDSYIYVIGEQPVLVCWGFGPGTPGVEPQNLTRITAVREQTTPSPPPPPRAEPAAEPQPVAAMPVASRPLSPGWLWWLLPLLAACLLICLLFTSFGGAPSIAGTTLFNMPALFAAPADRNAEIAALENEISALRGKLEKHAALCVPEKRPEEITVKPPVAALPEPAPDKPVEITPEERNQANEDLVIPKHAEDTSFLEGRWICETGLANIRTHEPVQFAFEFGRNGKGRATVYEKNDQCTGATRAELRNGELRFIVDPQLCAKGNNQYMGLSIVCRDAGGAKTQCVGVNEDGTTWSADFKKVR